MTDLNHIQLPAGLIADMYKNHLVEDSIEKKSGPARATGTAESQKSIQFLGKNQQGICLLVNYAHDVYLPDNELNFLTSILQACKLNLGDVAIINCRQQKISLEVLQAELSCRNLLLFGVNAGSIGLPAVPLFTITILNGCQVLASPPTEELNNNQPDSKLLKGKLWACLKQLFGV